MKEAGNMPEFTGARSYYYWLLKQAILSTAIVLLYQGSLFAQSEIDKTKGRFYFQEFENHDMDTINPPDNAYDTFWFENIGNSPIAIYSVTSSTPSFVSADWTREEVKPQQRGYIACCVKTAKHTGPFNAEFMVVSNAINTTGGKVSKLYLKGTVGKPKATKTIKKKKPVKKQM